MVPHLYLQVIVVAVVRAATSLLWTAVCVVFYFSCRCAVEHFDLYHLAENIGATPALPDATDDSRAT